MKGIITKIEEQKRSKNRVNVYIDEEFSFACSLELIYKYKLIKGQEVDGKELEKVAEEDNFLKAKAYAFRVLEKSYKTEKEIEDKLIQRGYEKKVVSRIMDLLKEYDFMNDERYIKAYIKDNIKKQGKKKLYYNLKNKGINEELLKEELDKIPQKTIEKSAYDAGEKKYLQLIKKEQDNYKLYNKLTGYLMSKGYDYEICKSVA